TPPSAAADAAATPTISAALSAEDRSIVSSLLILSSLARLDARERLLDPFGRHARREFSAYGRQRVDALLFVHHRHDLTSHLAQCGLPFLRRHVPDRALDYA